MEIAQKVKNRTVIQSSYSTSGYLSEAYKTNMNLKRNVHPDVHSSIIYNNQDMETT